MLFIDSYDSNSHAITKIKSTASGELRFQETYNGDTIYEIGRDACKSNSYITLLDFRQTKIKAIRYQAFYNCKAVTEIFLPETLITLEVNAFRFNNITKITIPPNLETLDGAFSMCLYLNEFILDRNNRFIVEAEGIYNTDYTQLIRAHGNVTYESISHFDTITSFGQYAFSRTNLDKFTSTKKITQFRDGTFENCPQLY